MHRITRHIRLLVLIIGLAAGTATIVWGTLAAGQHVVPTTIGDVLGWSVWTGFEMIPFLALAVTARRLPWWGSLATALAFAAALLEAEREVVDSTSSTAFLLIFFAPVMLTLAVPILVAVCDLIRLLCRRRARRNLARPGRWHVMLGVAAVTLGFLVMGPFGSFAGLALAFAIWVADADPGGAGDLF